MNDEICIIVSGLENKKALKLRKQWINTFFFLIISMCTGIK